MGKTLTGSYAYHQLTNPSLDPLTVASTGSISSLAGGIALYGSRALAWDVTNLGRITAVGTSSTGVLLENGGTVANGQAGGGGYISGGRHGISVAQAAGTVVNFGTVTADAPPAGVLAGGTGVFPHGGGTIANFGVIGGYQTGAAIAGTAGTITNYGTVHGTGTILTYGVVLGATTTNLLTNRATGYIGAKGGIGR